MDTPIYDAMRKANRARNKEALFYFTYGRGPWTPTTEDYEYPFTEPAELWLTVSSNRPGALMDTMAAKYLAPASLSSLKALAAQYVSRETWPLPIWEHR
jgi:hypothetical protein